MPRTRSCRDDDDEDDRMEALFEYYDEVKTSLGIGHTIWSMTEVDDLDKVSGYPGGGYLIVEEHRSRERLPDTRSLTWARLWVAVDQVFEDEGDIHHPFIEGFKHLRNGDIEVVLGS